MLFLASEGHVSLAVLLLRASQLSSPVQKRVMSAVRAAMDFGFSWPRWRASHSSRMLCLKAAGPISDEEGVLARVQISG